jgi:NAD(P)-dependent dehydrogenase (short-subunit alcohol dehydrogenase family)
MMQDKTVLITGASTGTGLAMASALAGMGASVLMVSRDPERARRARDEVVKAATGKPPTTLLADLSSQADVRRLAGLVESSTGRLDVLINNAGAAFRHRQLSVDGIERTLATNHLGSFLLTNLLLGLLRAARASRIVNVTARMHTNGIDFDNLQLEHRYGALRAYALSKACNILFTYELARRLSGSSIQSNCFCPGPTETNFARTAGGSIRVLESVARLIGVLRPVEEGARTGVYLASSPEVANVTGRYFRNGKPARSKPGTYDESTAARLWEVSDGLCRLGNERNRTFVSIAPMAS